MAMNVLRMILGHAEGQELIETNPVEAWKRGRPRRIFSFANLGALPFLFAIAMLESNDARKVAVAFALVYAAAITFWVVQASRCPKCRSLLSTRDLMLGQTKVIVPWFFKPSCDRCGWRESDSAEHDNSDSILRLAQGERN